MVPPITLIFLTIYEVYGAPKLVSYIGQTGVTWVNPAFNEEFLENIGVPGYGGAKGYNVLNFAFWVSDSDNGGAAVNGAAFDWQNILERINSASLRETLTGNSTPTADELRAGIKSLYASANIEIFISAFGQPDQPMGNDMSASIIGSELAIYAKQYLYDGVDVDWEEAYHGYFSASENGESWLCELTNTLRLNLDSNQKITHSPQAPYFMTPVNGGYGTQYPKGGYNKVHDTCGDNIHWYNVQFYNQGSTTYNTYSSLFETSIGWSENSAVYQIMNVIPGDKIIVGKHTYGDGAEESFVSGDTIKSMLIKAFKSSDWRGGFMSWQFYHEVHPSQPDGRALIDHLSDSDWNTINTSGSITTQITVLMSIICLLFSFCLLF